jgi:hypothetical protein
VIEWQQFATDATKKSKCSYARLGGSGEEASPNPVAAASVLPETHHPRARKGLKLLSERSRRSR